ncbi:Uncharacterised protein [Mycobacteroides abscessus subsp. massiliense]|nr:Uncharacterised protein [Mycobacteroides abscessus subsp. massiliense]
MLVLATAGLVVAWAAIILRAPLAFTRLERMLLAAIASMLVLTTLFNPHVATWFNEVLGVGGGDLVRHVSSIITSAAMVAFALAPSRSRHIHWWLWAAVATLAAMLALRLPTRFTAELDQLTETPFNGTFGTLSLLYYVLLAGYCVAALAMTIAVFLRAASAIADGYTAISLQLISVSFGFNALAWIAVVAEMLTDAPIFTRYIPAMDGLNFIFMAAGLLVALAAAIRSRRRLAAVTSRLRPLWEALTKSVPDVVLRHNADPVRRYDVQRMAIELRDCLLILGAYVTEADLEKSRERAALISVGRDKRHQDAVVTALSLRAAQANKDTGSAPAIHKILLMDSSAATLDDELAELLILADAYQLTGDHHKVGAP